MTNIVIISYESLVKVLCLIIIEGFVNSSKSNQTFLVKIFAN